MEELNKKLTDLLVLANKMIKDPKNIKSYVPQAVQVINELKFLIAEEKNQEIKLEESPELLNIIKLVRTQIEKTDVLTASPSISNWQIGYDQMKKLSIHSSQVTIWPTNNSIARKVVNTEVENYKIPKIPYKGSESADEMDCIVLLYTPDYSKPVSSHE